MLRKRKKSLHSKDSESMKLHGNIRNELLYFTNSRNKSINIDCMDKNHIINSINKLKRTKSNQKDSFSNKNLTYYDKTKNELIRVLILELDYREFHKI
jgi:hypothetical protein